MAIRRDPPKRSGLTSESFGAVRIDQQDVRDIADIFERMRATTPWPNRPVHLAINSEYQADTVDDVLSFERPITTLAFDVVGSVGLTIYTLEAYLIYDKTKPDQRQARDDLVALLKRRSVNVPRVTLLPLVLGAVGSLVLGYLALLGLGFVGVQTTTPMAVATGIGSGLIGGATVSSVEKRQRESFRSSIFIPSETPPNILRRYSNEITIFLGLLSLLVAIVAAAKA